MANSNSKPKPTKNIVSAVPKLTSTAILIANSTKPANKTNPAADNMAAITTMKITGSMYSFSIGILFTPDATQFEHLTPMRISIHD